MGVWAAAGPAPPAILPDEPRPRPAGAVNAAFLGRGDRDRQPLLDLEDGPLGISPGRRLWIAFFDTPEGLVAVMIGGSVAKWDEALLAAEPVLESVTIGH